MFARVIPFFHFDITETVVKLRAMSVRSNKKFINWKRGMTAHTVVSLF